MGKSLGRAFKHMVEREEEIIAETRPLKTKESLFMNPTRRKIYEYLTSKPCSHLRKVARGLGTSPPTVKWHLDKLINRGFVGNKRLGKNLVFYPLDLLDPQDISVAAAINSEKSRKIVSAVNKMSGVTQRELGDEIGIGYQAVRWHAAQLEEVGILESVVDGRYRRYYLTDLIMTKIDENRKRRKHYREALLKKLAEDGVAPELVQTTDASMTVRIRTGRDKATLKIITNPYPTLLGQ